MRMIDIGWRDLAVGYEAVRECQDRLEKEFGRAVKIGHARRFRRELTDWQKKRRVFIVLAVIAPLSIAGLCVAAYYFRDVSCVIAYWALLVAIILVALAIAGRNYIREAVNRPEPRPANSILVDLEQRWWKSLSPESLAIVKKGGKDGEDFPTLLGCSLPDTYLGLAGAPEPEGQEILLAGPSGIWLFEARPWSGVIIKQEGTWRQVRTLRDKLGRARREETVHEPGPDDRWLQRKAEILGVLREQLPGLEQVPETATDEGAGLVQGGVVFSHPRVALDKSRIRGNTAAYGPVAAWIERLRRSRPWEGFTLEACLQALDALEAGAIPAGAERVETAPSREAADRLYQEAVREMRSFISRMVS